MKADNAERARQLDWIEQDRKRLLAALERERTVHVPEWRVE